MRKHRRPLILVVAAALLLSVGLIAILWGHQIALLIRARATVADRSPRASHNFNRLVMAR